MGGFFSRQMWGWGNCDLFENFKFQVAHAHCGSLEVLSEHDDRYFNDNEERRWLEHLARDEDLRDSVWPHANEWQEVGESWEGSHEKWRGRFETALAQRRTEAANPLERGPK